jgi:hypothetical protein
VTCKWNGRGNPRLIPGRHSESCADETCAGCQECAEAHCRVCGVTHMLGTCAECMAETREALHEIARMCDALPDEVENRGIEGEAMFLLGPAADPEAVGHVEASVQSGRLPDGYLDDATGELHPAWILGTWEMVYRDALEHHKSADDDGDEIPFTISAATDYLDGNLTYAGGFEHVPFEDFARDLRRCRNHLEAVLHDGEQVDRGAPCMTCHAPLERTWGADEKADGWKCPRCKQTSTDEQYRFAVMHLHREEADWLTDRDMQIRTGVRAGTVRSWATKGLIRRRQDQGRRVYSVADVVRRAGIVGEESA